MEINILGVIWLVALFGVANMAPVFCKKIPFLGCSIDCGKSWRGKRIFGDNKTWRGVLAASILGFLFFIIQRQLFIGNSFFSKISLFDYQAIPWFYGFLIGLGAILGDAVKSFFKRRANVAPGHSWIPFDQIDYLVGGIIALLPFYKPSLIVLLAIILLGFILHLLVKFIGYILKISDKKI